MNLQRRMPLTDADVSSVHAAFTSMALAHRRPIELRMSRARCLPLSDPLQVIFGVDVVYGYVADPAMFTVIDEHGLAMDFGFDAKP